MKYKAKTLVNGKHAVMVNKNQYFLDQVYDTLQEAQEAACVVSAHWYREQADKCQRDWEALRVKCAATEEEKEEIEYSAYNAWNDLMA